MPKNKKNGTYDRIRKIIEKDNSKIHFVGIGGVSMYSLARLTFAASSVISGSDREVSPRTESLTDHGIVIANEHSENNISDQELVVYSHAIAEDNPELTAARKKAIPTVTRAEYLGAFMTEYKKRVGVSGTHGKSTTVAMLDLIFAYCGMNHTTLSGASLATGEPFRMGSTELLLYEGCEYKDSFLRFSPTYITVTNLEYDHPDYFPSLEAVKDSFLKAVLRSKYAIMNYDDYNLRSVISRVKGDTKAITFGQNERADYRYRVVSFEPSGCSFTIEHRGEELGLFQIHLPGAYNVINAAAAAVTALVMGLSPEDIAASLSAFRGIEARLQYLGHIWGRDIYRDYAHHPTEIRAAINALKIHSGDSVTVVFKPHTYSRTKAFFEDFRLALSLADNVILTDIYPAREEPIEGISSERLASDIGDKAVYCKDEDVKSAVESIEPGAVLLMGAGDMKKIAEDLFK